MTLALSLFLDLIYLKIIIDLNTIRYCHILIIFTFLAKILLYQNILDILIY